MAKAAKNAKKKDAPSKKRRSFRRLLRRLRPRPSLWPRPIRYAFYTIIGIVLAPFFLTILYRFDFINPVSTLMLSRSIAGYERTWVDLEETSPRLYQSVLMSEDGQFCNHHGVDLAELKGVLERAMNGEATRGASTITMQTAKNLYLWGGRSFIRKGLELPLALWIDLIIPKHRIMEIYLNIAEWGPDNQFGIGAAAIHHFGKHPADLTRRESALLAVTLPNPIVRNPKKPSKGMRNVARIV